MVQQVLEILKNNKYFSRRITHIEVFPPYKPVHCDIDGLSPSIVNYLRQKGIKLYLHQCKVIELARQGKNVIITTPTASGKSLAYNISVFEALMKTNNGTALYLFPTKALTNDQLKPIRELEQTLGFKVYGAIYDGDTPTSVRSLIRQKAKIILTNPYELHQVLAWHHQWIRFFSNLKFIVVDEAHQYRGVFGANVAYLFRRLRRILNKYGSNPQFILSSATLANPNEFAKNLVGLDFELVDEDGAPKGRKTYVLYNPFIDPNKSASALEDASRLLATFVYYGLKTLVFTKSRRAAELIARRSRQLLENKNHFEVAEKITAYRAGYLPTERRTIEEQFKSGKLMGIASTNALELGIDIGDLDAVIITGFPGSIISTFQQAGRAGRKANDALIVFVAYHDKIDQYFVKNPHAFFSHSFEYAVVDMKNPYISTGQILCASAEAPLNEQDELYFPKEVLYKTIKALENKRLIRKTLRGWVYTGKVSPAQLVSLDNIGTETFKVLYQGKVLETLDKIHAFKEAHHGAVLLHQGETFVVKDFDLQNKIITVEKKNIDYHTVPLKEIRIDVIETLKEKYFGDLKLNLGKLNVSEHFTGYKIKKGSTVLGYEKLDLPPIEFETVGLWFVLDEDLAKHIWEMHPTKSPSVPSIEPRLQRYNSFYDPYWDMFAGGLHGTEHALIGLMPFIVMADRANLGGLSTIKYHLFNKPAIFIYDAFPGGIGLTEKAFELFDKLTFMTYQTVSQCKCEGGCPACIMSPKCGSDNRPLDKFASIKILEYMTNKIKQL